MSETKLKEQPEFLRDRYGYRPTPVSVIVFGIVALLAVGAIAVWLALRTGAKPVQASLIVWSIKDDHVEMTFEVNRPGSDVVECAVRAQNREHHDVGYATVTIPAGAEYVQTTYSVATNGRAYGAQLLGCAPKGELIVAAPDFPPGEPNPPQPWRN